MWSEDDDGERGRQSAKATKTITLSAEYAQAFCKPSAYTTHATGIY